MNHLKGDEKYTMIPNEMLEALAKAKLNGTQYAICLVIFRNTYGFHRCEHEMSATYISKATDIATRQIKRELQTLIDRNIIFKTNLKQGVTSTLGFNKDTGAWKQVTKKTQVTNPSPVVVTKTTPVPVTNPSPKKEKKKSIKEIYIAPMQNLFDFWNEQGIVVHQLLSDKIKKALVKALEKHSEDEIGTAIFRYSEVYHDSDYFFNYKWDLDIFVSRGNGLPTFLDGGEKWVNYLNSKKQTKRTQSQNQYEHDESGRGAPVK